MAELDKVDPPKLSRIDPTVAATLKISDVTAIVGQPYELTLTATNNGKVKVAVPINRKSAKNEWVWSGIGIRFSLDPAIQQASIFTNPPTIDYILPGETKGFRLTWTPRELHAGSGELSLILPPEFEPVTPVKVTVEKKIDQKSKGEPVAPSGGEKPSK